MGLSNLDVEKHLVEFEILKNQLAIILKNTKFDNTYLSLSGDNANQNINIGAFDLTTTGDIIAGDINGTSATITGLISGEELLIDNININGATISSDTGAISFSNDDTITTGTNTAENMEIINDTTDGGGRGMTITRNKPGTIRSALCVLRRYNGGNKVDNTEAIGEFAFQGWDGVQYQDSSRVYAYVDGVTSVGVVPIAVEIQTGTASWGTARLTVASGGDFDFHSNNLNAIATADIGNITISGATISCSTGAISFVNENLSTTGLGAFGSLSTTEFQVEADGDTYWVGAGSGLPFGSFYGNEFNQSQVMTTNTEYQVAHASIATGQSNNITTDGNGKFTITKAGKYQVFWSITASHSAVGKHVLWGIALDQLLQADGQQHRETIAADKEYQISGNGIIGVAVGEDIEIGFKSADGTPGTATISHMNLTVTQVGG